MDIQILQLIEGAEKARGLAVIIDVFRAFTVECYAYANNASDIITVGALEEAYRIKKGNPDYILMGERQGRIQAGFDFGNSPAAIENVDFTGKTLIHTTSAGTQGIANALNADEIITGSFVNAKAISRYILAKEPEILSLVCMGAAGIEESEEDTFCALYIKSLINNTHFDLAKAKEILKHGSGSRFFDPANSDWSPERDFHLSMNFNMFDFVLKAEKSTDGYIHLKKLVI
jgi:2-phosphosulfolactate phosphatase